MSDIVNQVKCGFFDSVDGDRKYFAEDMNLPYKRLISDGIFANQDATPSTDFDVFSAGGMTLQVRPGQAILAGKWFISETSIFVTVPANSTASSRIDSVILQVNKSASGRAGNVVYRTGGASAPDINTDADIVEYRIANVSVTPFASTIGNGLITDLRGTSSCPWITSLIYQPDNAARIDEFISAYGVSNGTKINKTVLYASDTPVPYSPDSSQSISADIRSFDEVEIEYQAFGITGNVRIAGSKITTWGANTVEGADGIPEYDTGFHWDGFRAYVGDSLNPSQHCPIRRATFRLGRVDATHIEWSTTVWNWSGIGTDSATALISDRSACGITKITGITYVDAGTVKDPELSDLRVSADGTTYASARAALLAQIQAATLSFTDPDHDGHIKINFL